MSFTYVRIPADSSQACEEVAAVCGGLEGDTLKLSAAAFFAAQPGASAAALAAAREADIRRACAESGQALPDEALLARAAAHKASCEITLLTVPKPPDFLSVSLYSDADAAASGARPNARASALAHACGHPESTILRGDVFLSRCKDDERGDEWRRVPIALSEVDVLSPWVRAAAEANRGKSLSNFSSGGAMQDMLANLQGRRDGGGVVAPEGGGSGWSLEDGAATRHSWRQASVEGVDCVEVRVRVPPGTRAKGSGLSVVITATTLHLALPPAAAGVGGEHAEGVDVTLAALATPGGAPLFARVTPGDSSWVLEGGCVVVTLAKAGGGVWTQLLK